MVTSQEQFEIMRSKMEEEHRKDIEALERLQRFMPVAQASLKNREERIAPIAPPPSSVEHTVKDEAPGSDERPTLIGAVLVAVHSKPNTSMTGRDVLAALESQGFPLVGDERRRLTSIGQALTKLAERDPAPIRVVRRGKGKAPNIYRAVVPTVNPAHLANATAQTATATSELTM